MTAIAVVADDPFENRQNGKSKRYPILYRRRQDGWSSSSRATLSTIHLNRRLTKLKWLSCQVIIQVYSTKKSRDSTLYCVCNQSSHRQFRRFIIGSRWSFYSTDRTRSAEASRTHTFDRLIYHTSVSIVCRIDDTTIIFRDQGFPFARDTCNRITDQSTWKWTDVILEM